TLHLSRNQLTSVPEWLGRLAGLVSLYLPGNQLGSVPESLGRLDRLRLLNLFGNHLTSVPDSLGGLARLQTLQLRRNPPNPELSAAYAEGLGAVKAYLRAKAQAQVVLNEGKLILVGEGEVGKSCLLDALRGEPWKERASTHGIEVRPVEVTAPNGTKI